MFLNISITILLSSNIPNNLLKYANSLLNFFVSDFENIYGKHMLSHNIHGTLHIFVQIMNGMVNLIHVVVLFLKTT